MNTNNNVCKYNLENNAFKERERFFKKTLNVNPRDYFIGYNDDISFEKGRFFKDVLYKTLSNYLKADNSIISADFNLDEYMAGISDDDAEKIPIIVFDRNKINDIYNARGEEIKKWMQENLKNFSDKVIESHESTSTKTLAGIMAGSSVISISGVCCKALTHTYGAYGAMAPVMMEGTFSVAEEVKCIFATLSSSPVVVAVIAAAVAIGTAILMVATLDRKLVGLIVNDTNYDISVEDIYMKHGISTAYPDDPVYKSVIPAKKRENEVYASFFVIEKDFGFYGTECTLRLKTYPDKDSFYLLTANPLSEESRINLVLKNDISKIGGHRYTSSEMHDELYSSGSTQIYSTYKMFDISGNLNSAHGENAYAAICFSQHINDYAVFTKSEAEYHGSLACVGSDKFEYCNEKNCYEIKPGGFCCFSSYQVQDKLYLVKLMTDNAKDNNTVCYFGGHSKLELADSNDFVVYTIPYLENNPSNNLNESEILELRNCSDTATVYVKSLAARYMQTPLNNCNWMSKIDNSIPLEDINIPGTHDSAAINKYSHSLYACHYSDITKQLTDGIRLLDIRIKVKNNANKIVFMTCHGNIGCNEYQSLESVFEECTAFLNKYCTETILMSLKIDDFSIDESCRNEAYDLLQELLNKYPIKEYNKSLGTLGNSRGKIILFNRINSEERFGYPISWEDNTQGSYAYDSEKRDFKVYVQDHWNLLSPLTAISSKWKCVKDTMKMKKAGDSTVVWNYASACVLFVLGAYIGPELLQFFGTEKSTRLTKFGWILMDYEDTAYPTDFYGMMDIPSVIIASNFDYSGCSSPFKVLIKDEL